MTRVWLARIALLIATLVLAPVAEAQTFWTTPGGSGVNGSVGLCLNNLNLAVPCSDPSSLPSAVTGTKSNASSGVATSSNNIGGDAFNYGFNGTSWDQLQVDLAKNLKVALNAPLPAGANTIGNVNFTGLLPVGAIAITASATGTTGATTATLPGIMGHTTYLCEFSIRANATAAATGNATITGTVSGTMNFTQWTAPLASGLGVTEPPIGPACIPASASNTAIAVNSAAPGSGGTVSVSAWGYQL